MMPIKWPLEAKDDMPKITFITHDGVQHEVQASIGTTLMETAVSAMVPGIEADCGGNCICATCHVYIDTQWLSKLPPAEDVEEAMIDYTSEPSSNSRLACQIEVTDEIEGLQVRIPADQH